MPLFPDYDDDDFIKKIYIILLKREPEEGGQEFYKQRLEKGFSRYSVVYDIWSSLEFKCNESILILDKVEYQCGFISKNNFDNYDTYTKSCKDIIDIVDNEKKARSFFFKYFKRSYFEACKNEDMRSRIHRLEKKVTKYEVLLSSMIEKDEKMESDLCYKFEKIFKNIKFYSFDDFYLKFSSFMLQQ